MSNRIAAAADRIQTLIDAGGIDGALDSTLKLTEFEAGNDVEMWESAKYRDYNALAFANGLLSLDEANMVYNALGREGMPQGNGGWSKGTSLALKVAITSLMAQLVGSAIASR